MPLSRPVSYSSSCPSVFPLFPSFHLNVSSHFLLFFMSFSFSPFSLIPSHFSTISPSPSYLSTYSLSLSLIHISLSPIFIPWLFSILFIPQQVPLFLPFRGKFTKSFHSKIFSLFHLSTSTVQLWIVPFPLFHPATVFSLPVPCIYDPVYVLVFK